VRCVREVYDLDTVERALHLHEMAEVAQAAHRAFQPVKMNLEALGNGVPHLHWHIVPRAADDVRPRGPIWENFDFLRLTWTRAEEADEQVRHDTRTALLDALTRTDVEIEQTFV